MDGQTMMITVALLGIVAVGAGVFAFAGSSAERQSAKRIDSVSSRGAKLKVSGGAGSAADPADKRRKAVADTLKELDRKAKAQKKKLTLRQTIEQAGWTMSVRKFWIISAVVGLIIAFVCLGKGLELYIALGAGLAGAFGLPRWVLGYFKNRRQKKFLTEFANSIDVIVRGVKSGLPLNDCLRIIGAEAPDPVGSEFRMMIEGLRLGMTMEDALKRFHEHMPLPEVNFFQIVLSIQSKSGGNLSEALSNLSAVLRDRKRLQGKIKALSSEAKSSAMIIGSLPEAVMILVYFTTPGYLDVLFTTRIGNLLMVGCVVWMTCGVLMMKKMISFKY